ncbi:hypothetical protein EDB86DRAFT_2830509 [Lactarius hatsudake]|nr:hypothetical protein EDB86DRAFT_2830509 [Lactarius hatsudake]
MLPLGTRDEAYSLAVPADSSAAVTGADSTLGLLCGLTLSQLWYTASGTVNTSGAPVAISYSPAYPYRGFMLDMPGFLSRSFPGFTDVAQRGTSSASAVYTQKTSGTSYLTLALCVLPSPTISY